MDLSQRTFDEIKKGYRFDGKTSAFVCNYCERSFPEGQIFTVDERQYMAEHAAKRHIDSEHGGNLHQLVHADTKYNSLSDNQRELLTLFAAGLPDGDIARQLGVSASTVRHQKFMFREKAKQAKLYLAQFEQTFTDRPLSGEAIIPIHNQAVYYDDRYVITEQERTRILETLFESLEPLKLKVFSAKEKKKVVILAKIAEQFEPGRAYTEKEVNQIIKEIYDDYGTIRRYLIMYGYMERATDGSQYRLTT